MNESLKYLLHYDEICLKKGNQRFFENILLRNLKDALNPHCENKLHLQRHRILLECSEIHQEEIEKILSRVSGLCHFSPVKVLPPDLDKMREACLALLKELGEGSFKVDVKRLDKSFPLNSPEISREIGATLHETLKNPVDLKTPQHTLHLQVFHDQALLSGRRVKGLGGLPVGSSGRVLSFLSGGIDSPVAAYQMFSRGCSVSFVHFHNLHEDGEAVSDKVNQLAKSLSYYQPYTRLYMVPFGELQRALIAFIPSQLRMIVYRRTMFRIGSVIARKEKSKAYITGDSVGQVASQTLDNLIALHEVADRPILSPLISWNKSVIIEKAREIKTFDVSILPYDDCCSFLLDEHPEISADLEEIRNYEEPIEFYDLIEKCLKETEVIAYQSGKEVRRKKGGIYMQRRSSEQSSSSSVSS